MDVIVVRAQLFKGDVVAFGDFSGDFPNCRRYVLLQESLAVFDGKDDVVVRVVDAVVALLDAHALQCI